MKKFELVVHETRKKTYLIDATSYADAIRKYKYVPYQELIDDECINEEFHDLHDTTLGPLP